MPEVYDDELDARIHYWYGNIYEDATRKGYPSRGLPHFTPSSLDECPRALYERIKGAKRDKKGQQPHQGRWTRLETAIGDMIQRDLLFMEKHMKTPFRLERNEEGEPMFEEFAKTRRDFSITQSCETLQFSLLGACDGILHYSYKGKDIRVGLEIKSKQTTAARTSVRSLREPSESHVKQCLAYSILYNLNHYLVVYVNASKSGWSLSEEQCTKTPDVRAFHLYFTEEDKQKFLDELARTIYTVKHNDPPFLDPTKWMFNNYKTAVAVSLSGEELEDLERYAYRMRKSSLPETQKRVVIDCYEGVQKIRKGWV